MRLKLSMAVIMLAGTLVAPLSAFAQPEETRDEQRARRCAAYRETAGIVLKELAPGELTPGFVRAHDAFLAAGCLSPVPACPKSAADFAFADRLFIFSVSANMGSTFTPFRCPTGPGG